jgi:hypothetical protein
MTDPFAFAFKCVNMNDRPLCSSGEVIAVLTSSILQLKQTPAKSDRFLRMLQASAQKIKGVL